MSKLAKSKSTWTPLSNREMNEKIYNERRLLASKWFEKWTDDQRLQVIEDLIGQMRVKQLEKTKEILTKRKNFFHEDFTRCLPRVISIYIFSLLDPRSLSRCAQVCWHWKWITELDQLWMKKCLRLGWMLPSTRNNIQEMGAWKKYYIENISAFKSTVQLTARKLSARDKTTTSGSFTSLSIEKPKKSPKSARPPWKGSDPTPKDTWRNNYLDNEDEVDKYNRIRKLGIYSYILNELPKKSKEKNPPILKLAL